MKHALLLLIYTSKLNVIDALLVELQEHGVHMVMHALVQLVLSNAINQRSMLIDVNILHLHVVD